MDDEDETWYFMAAKKIKINAPGKDKKVVIVHAECLKQIEMNRIQSTVEAEENNGGQ